jgi:hypothetical protein
MDRIIENLEKPIEEKPTADTNGRVIDLNSETFDTLLNTKKLVFVVIK